MVKKLPRKRPHGENQPRRFARGILRAGGIYLFTKTEFRKLRLAYGHDRIVKNAEGKESIVRIPASYRATLAAEGIAHVR